MTYQFKLEALRRYRQHQEEALQKKLADAQRALEDALNRLSEHLAARERTAEDMQHCQCGATTGPQMTVYLQYLQKLTEDIAGQQEIVHLKRKACDQAREQVLEAMKRRKALDKLKDKGLKRYLENLDHEEGKFINEMAINRYNHRHR